MAAHAEPATRKFSMVEQLHSLCDEIHGLAKDTILKIRKEATDCAFWKIASFTLPTPDNRRENPNQCYWTAPGGDIRKDAVPCVMLLQGPRDPETNKLHPERLPGGKTAVQLVDQSLKSKGWGLRLIFNGKDKTLNLYVVDLSRESEFKKIMPSERPKSKAWMPPVDEEEEEEGMSLDEYRARQRKERS
jgi:hypothetical protein